jgi:hypothetical protein
MEAMSIGRWTVPALNARFYFPIIAMENVLTSGGRKYVSLFELDASRT